MTRLAQAVAAALCASALVGCQNLNHAPEDADQPRAHNLTARAKPKPAFIIAEQEKTAPKDVWERMRDGFALEDDTGVNPRIEQQRLWFVSNPSFLENASDRGSLYLHYIVERCEERDIPLEIALLPVIESAFNPMAYSRSHAVGLWQFVPATGRYYNLRQNRLYDGRRDITASTNAALDYLSRLHDMFNGDWLLALAAYNAGEGTVSRAIERNEKLGLPTDYWNLPLPQETRDYVPKLLALAQIVDTPDAYGINLTPIANAPYFEVVDIDKRLDLSRVAELAQIDQDELLQLNPAYKQGQTLDGPQHLLVPAAKAQLLSQSLSSLSDEQLASLRPKVIVAETAPMPAKRRVYRVKSGDNLTLIAKANRVSVHDLQQWNKLSGRNLKVGQTLMLADNRPSTRATSSRTVAKASANKATRYKVQKGDSLYLVAKRFNVPMTHLKRWNPGTARALKPGQTLMVYQDR